MQSALINLFTFQDHIIYIDLVRTCPPFSQNIIGIFKFITLTMLEMSHRRTNLI